MSLLKDISIENIIKMPDQMVQVIFGNNEIKIVKDIKSVET